MSVHYGADIEARDARGYTPLHIACTHDIDAMAALREMGADANARTAKGETPLQLLEQHPDNFFNQDIGMRQILELFKYTPKAKFIRLLKFWVKRTPDVVRSI